MEQHHHTFLGPDCPPRFVPPQGKFEVSFDETNKQVFSVRERDNGTEITVVSVSNAQPITFAVKSKGPFISLRFSLDQKILAIQKTNRTIDLVNATDNWEFTLECKAKLPASVVGFKWTFLNELCVVTSAGIELYTINPEKQNGKLVKSYAQPVNWFVYSHECRVLLVSTGALGNSMHSYHFRHGIVNRWARFDIELPPEYAQNSMKLLEREVTMGSLYGTLYCIHVRNSFMTGGRECPADIVLYQLTKEAAYKRSILSLQASGRFATSIVDNLVAVHHEQTRTSMLFDIRTGTNTLRSPVLQLPGMPGGSSVAMPTAPLAAGELPRLDPIVAPLPIAPPMLSTNPGLADAQTLRVRYDVSGSNWMAFQPNIIIDSNVGCIWEVFVDLTAIVTMVGDQCQLLDFLLRRTDGKAAILGLFKSAVDAHSQVPLATLSQMFDQVNAVYRGNAAVAGLPSAYNTSANASSLATKDAVSAGDRQAGSTAGAAALAIDASELLAALDLRNQHRIAGKGCIVVDQADMYKYVLEPMEEEHRPSNFGFVKSVLLEYIRSLNFFRIPVEHFLHQMMINLLVKHGKYYQLHQYLQYHVVSDSKPVAYALLSLENVYPPAYQLALDILKRLTNANSEIVDVLLSRNQILQALRFMRGQGQDASISARQFLEAAANTKDPILFYSIFKFFEQRNVRLRKHPAFIEADKCDDIVEKFRATFGSAAAVSNPSRYDFGDDDG
eukprot:Opistho-2@63209